MDRGAWQAAVLGVAEVGYDLAAKERERPEGTPKGEALAQRESRGGLQEENTGRREQNSLDSLFLCGTFPSPDSTPVQDYANLWPCSHQPVISCPCCW